MTVQNLPHPDVFRKLLRYCPHSGDFFWLPRPEVVFSRKSDFSHWNNRYAGNKAGCIDARGYVRIKLFGKMIAAHRMAWAFEFDCWPIDEIDHLNGVKSDNKISNLRCVSKSVNQRNKKLQANNKSGVPGVRFLQRSRGWEVRVCEMYVGHFASLDDAIMARKRAEKNMNFGPSNGK
jgi:hypothetical protein